LTDPVVNAALHKARSYFASVFVRPTRSTQLWPRRPRRPLEGVVLDSW